MGAVLPAAAVAPLRAATAVVATPDVADPAAWGAELLDGDPPAGAVVLTTDPAHPLVAAADVVITTPEPAGVALLDAVAVMDRLRSPGGCPWDAEQTHASLLQYLVEEAYELYEAIEDGDRAAMREELGDVLLQVLFHARVAAEDAAPFDVDDVAGDLVAKLVGRHPHVFAGSETIDTAERQEHRWDELKRAEKQRESSVDGVPMGQPAVALAAKLTSRTARAGFPAELLPSGPGVGEELFALAARAKLAGVDPEAELRTAARRFADRVRAAQKKAAESGADAHALDVEAWRDAWENAQDSSALPQ
ncbi:MAG: MazG family protein [Pseudonocardiaceae bacterium]|nr:MAG: MazG family protein [Pseudonocardiaceae bacterium]